MLSAVDICNSALLKIGHTDFIAILTENSVEATVCNKFYAPRRDEVLRKYDWPFARYRAQPAPLDSTTLALGAVPAPWLYAYAYPDTALAIRKIVWVPASTSPAFSGLWFDWRWRGAAYEYQNLLEEYGCRHAVENDSALKKRIILTDAGDTTNGADGPTIIFTAQVLDTTQYPDDFAEALAWRLAVDLALGIRKDPKSAQSAMAAYKAAIDEATSASRQESPRPRMLIAPHILARR